MDAFNSMYFVFIKRQDNLLVGYQGIYVQLHLGEAGGQQEKAEQRQPHRN